MKMPLPLLIEPLLLLLGQQQVLSPAGWVAELGLLCGIPHP
jgi:hypothetical protein